MSSGPELIQLNHEGLSATVDPFGAYLTSFRDEETDRDLLLPRQEIDGKVRGGSFVCLPIFDEYPGLDRHGFGRRLAWRVAYPRQEPPEVSNAAALELDIIGDEDVAGAAAYGGLSATLAYQIGRRSEAFMNLPAGSPSLQMDVRVSSGSGKALRIAPGFHPYFALPEGVPATAAQISASESHKRSFTAEELAETQHMLGVRRLLMGEVEVGIAYDYLRICAVWSENPDAYICVEPTRSGSPKIGRAKYDYLMPRESRHYAATFTWAKQLDQNLALG